MPGIERIENLASYVTTFEDEHPFISRFSKLLESDEKMESKIERTEVVVESQLEVEKVTEVFLGLNNGTVIEE